MKIHSGWGKISFDIEMEEVPSSVLLDILQRMFNNAGCGFTPEQDEKLVAWLQEREAKKE